MLNSVKCPAKPGNNQQVRICPQVRLGAGLSFGVRGGEARTADDQRDANRAGQGVLLGS